METPVPTAVEAGGLADGDELAARWHDLLGQYHRTTCALDRALVADHGISVSDFEVLQQLSATGGSMRMHDLADEVHLTQSALSRLITRLEKAALITRCACEDDRRAIVIALTEAGEERYRAAKPTHRTILLELAGGTGPDCDSAG